MLLGNATGQGLPDELYRDRTGPFPAGDLQQYSNPQWIHQQLVAHPEYRMKFADHTHRHFFNGGALTPEENDVRFMTRADEIDMAVIAESARWSDFGSSKRTRNAHWIPAVENIRNNYFPYRTDIVLGQLRNKGWYPDLDAPVFYINGAYQHGGMAAPPYAMTILNPNGSGTIYYTLDGSDPRLPGVSSGEGATIIVTEGAAKKVLVPSVAGDLSANWTDIGFNDAAWTSGSGGVGYERGSGYDPYFDIDVEAGMYGGNGSAFIRIPFTLTANQLADFGCLTLRMRYDDGFVAFLNGVEVAAVNAPVSPSWDSFATNIHDDAAAVVLQGFNIDGYAGNLVVGNNVLAIQGLNITATSSDFLISAELEASNCTSPSVSPGATTYGGAFTLPGTVHVKARVENGGEWSALNEATFLLP